MTKKKSDKYLLSNTPGNKSLDYTEEQLGFKRKYKGREVMRIGFFTVKDFEYNRKWLIVKANRHEVTLTDDGNNEVKLSYVDLHNTFNFID